MIKKINFYHSLIFFNFSIIISAFSFFRNNNLLMLCLFLILTIGISHGALDNIKGKKLLKFFNLKSMSTFYIGYLLLSLFIILIWVMLPKILLSIFLIVAAYHFGKKYKFLDKIFLKVLKNYPRRMPDIFFRMFSGSTDTVIKFLSNKSTILDDLSIILKMPKWIFIKALFRK